MASASTQPLVPVTGDTVFAAAGLTCLRGGRLVFRGLEFALAAGEALVLVGPNGCGKSSLLRLAAGLSQPFSGRLDWRGESVAAEPHAHAARLRYVGHLDAVKPTLTVRENLSVWAGLDGVAKPDVAALAALERFGLDHLAEVPGRYLSAGQKRRTNLARLLLRPVSLWLLDEPTTALDRAAAALLAAAIAAHREAGGILLVSTHTDLDLREPRVLDVSRFAVDADGDGPVDDAAEDWSQ